MPTSLYVSDKGIAMSIFIPLNLPSKEVVMAMVNRDNRVGLTFNDVDFSEAIDISDLGVGKNTSLTLVAKKGSTYYGNQSVQYNRLSITELFGNNVVLVTGKVGDHNGVVKLINDEYGLSLDPSELVSVEIDQDGVLTVKAAESYLYKPGTVIKVRDEFDDFVDKLHTLSNFTLPAAL